MQKNVFEENMIVYVPRTASLRLKLYFLMQRAFAENLQEVILFCIKPLDIRSCVRYNNTRRQGYGPRQKEYADVAELADALDSGSSSLKRVWVQIPSSAPKP